MHYHTIYNGEASVVMYINAVKITYPMNQVKQVELHPHEDTSFWSGM